ncbi:hypothetical protein SMSP1_00936 [Sedimentisphaera salicampi]|nr:hypothetical protein SMSP1_00936 [Sedimentisphaera salicampi]
MAGGVNSFPNGDALLKIKNIKDKATDAVDVTKEILEKERTGEND